MSSFEIYDSFLSEGGRDYTRFYERDQVAEVNNGIVRLFRRTANPSTPQVARAFRKTGCLTLEVVRDSVAKAELPVWYGYDPIDPDSILAIGENLDGCVSPAIDRLQAVRLSCHDGVSAWLSTTHSAEKAEQLWSHLPLIELEVPLHYVMPITALVEDTLRILEKETPVSQHETGVFGVIREDWIVDIR